MPITLLNLQLTPVATNLDAKHNFLVAVIAMCCTAHMQFVQKESVVLINGSRSHSMKM